MRIQNRLQTEDNINGKLKMEIGMNARIERGMKAR